LNRLTNHQESTWAGALGFGLAFAVNAVLIFLFSRMQLGLILAQPVNSLQMFDKLLVRLVASLILAGLAGALAGWIGAKVLGRKMPDLVTKKFRRRTAVSFGATQAIVVLPLLFYTAVIGYYERALSQEPLDTMILGASFGIVYGVVVGLFLGLSTVNWRRGWRVILGSIIGFGLGGFLAGFFAWLWLADKMAWLPEVVFFVLALAAFGLVGGAGLATMYYRVISLGRDPSAGKPRYLWVSRVEIAAGIFLGAILLFGALNAFYLLQVKDAPLNAVISLPTVGTHFTNPEMVSEAAAAPAIFAAPDGRPYLAWSEENDIFYSWQANSSWSQPVNISGSAAQPVNPQGAAELSGQVNMVWVEGGQIVFARCDEADCTAPVVLPVAQCAMGDSHAPAIAIDPAGLIMVTWDTDGGPLAYATWNSIDQPTEAGSGCVGTGANPRLTTTGNNAFQLVFDKSDGQVLQAQFAGSWQTPEALGTGHSPEIVADAQGQTYIAWCGANGQVTYLGNENQQTAVDFPPCQTRPGIAVDSDDRPHLVWYADQVEKNTGIIDADQSFLYESILLDQGWSDPAIVAASDAPVVPSLTAVSDGVLHLAWSDGSLAYTNQTPYDCAGIEPETEAGQRVLDALSQPKFHPSDQPVPYCQNRYDTLLFTPNPDPAFSDQPPRVNSAFEYMRDLEKTAQYEVLFVTMQWVPDDDGDSPGLVIAEGVADLYRKIQEDPAQYPRGMTVRILLGNMPAFNVFQLNNQVWNVLADLRDAGVTEMVNEEIGWRVQVANYSGLWPHSHAKLMVIDGKTALSKGINVSYLHYPIDNPSGQGLSMVDYGIVATGPVAQHAVATYDDLWNGSHEVVCDNMNPVWSKLWLLTCDRVTAVPDHTPETLRFYVPGDADDIVFSQYRSRIHFASDEAVLAALSTAEEKLDIFEVNFTLEFACEAGIVFAGICDYENHALPFMRMIMEQIETNHIPVRILVEEDAMDGMENKVAIQAFVAELEKRGLSEYVDIHFYNGKMHAKGFIVDDKFLVVGSQNFQYSSWGDKALNEYNLSTENAEAIDTYKNAFEFYWADSTSAAEVMALYPEGD
jgi:phosphatidylserine/phosphatidylglycerophosphate/cardiolipin synthase-like enzyme/MFS family permease